MNRKILFSTISILSALALMSGATFAFFSSTATSTGNVFAAGTLTMQLDDNDEITPAATVVASFGGTSLAPGGAVSGFVSMHNSGSIAMAEVNLSSTETVLSSPDLAGKLNITSAKIGTESTCTTAPVDITLSFTNLGALNALGAPGFDLPSSALAAGATKYLCMTFTLDSGTDNTYQGKSITESFSFTGHQDLSQ